MDKHFQHLIDSYLYVFEEVAEKYYDFYGGEKIEIISDLSIENKDAILTAFIWLDNERIKFYLMELGLGE